MIELEARLANESIKNLRQRRSNAVRIAVAQAGTPMGDKAESHLRLIEAELEHRSLPGNIQTFLDKFPLGFADPEYLRQERADKFRASEYCHQHLSKAAFEAVDGSADTADLLAHVCKLVTMLNLIQGSFEKPKLLDAIRKPEVSLPFLTALGSLIHGEGELASRIDGFAEALAAAGLSRKWTYASYFLFLSDSARCVFVKPDGLKKALEITNYPFSYESDATSSGYRDILKFANWLGERLRSQVRPELNPSDMIDVQSFMWHMAPTGKYAR